MSEQLSAGNSNRISLVTGASRGIGRAVALALAAQGDHVLLLARDADNLASVYDEITALGGQATGIPLDITDYAGLDRLGAVIAEKWGRLDVLVGNAAILGPMTPVAHISPDEFDKLMAVNVTANARLIRTLEPLLLASPAGRAVFVTSGVAQSAKPFWGGYATSKAALNTLVRCWAHEQKETKLKVNLLSPGPVRTAMRAKAMPGEDPENLPRAEEIAPLFIKMLSPDWQETGQIVDYRQMVD
ncbi:MAG: SDR family NAD(P)-dependent oxidoreductase [Parvibaculales bacterium]